MNDADVHTAYQLYQLLNDCDVAKLYCYIPVQYIPMNDKTMPNGHVDIKPSIAVLWLTAVCSSTINEFDDACNAKRILLYPATSKWAAFIYTH